LLWLLAGCASPPRAPLDEDDTAAFPLPLELRPAVDFWRDVYAVWSRRQVAIHDNRYLDVVYEVTELPGPLTDSLTPEQRAWVDALQARWQARLATMAESGPMSAAEHTLQARLVAAGGPEAPRTAAQRVRAQRGLRERFKRGLEIGARYDATLRTILRGYGLPEDLAYLPHVESSFQLHARSSVGAAGVWQLMPTTGREHALTVDDRLDERLDPVLAAEGAARYLRAAWRQLDSWPLALTAYNHGIGGMRAARARYGTDIARIVREYDGRAFGFASRNFYAEFLAARHVARHAARYFPEGLQPEPPFDDEPLRLTHATAVAELARQHDMSVAALIERNPAWRAPVRRGEQPVPAGSTVWLPRVKRADTASAALFAAWSAYVD